MQIIYHGSYCIAFCTEKALKCVKFVGVKEIK